MWGVRLRSAVEWKSAVPVQVPVPGSSPNGKGSSCTNRLKSLGGDSARNALQDVAFTWRRVSWPRHPPKVRFGYADDTGPIRAASPKSQLSLLLLHSSLANPADSDLTACLETLPVSSGLQLPVGSTPQWPAGGVPGAMSAASPLQRRYEGWSGRRMPGRTSPYGGVRASFGARGRPRSPGWPAELPRGRTAAPRSLRAEGSHAT